MTKTHFRKHSTTSIMFAKRRKQLNYENFTNYT